MTDDNDKLLKRYLSIEEELEDMKKKFKQEKKQVTQKLQSAKTNDEKNKIVESFDKILNQMIINNKEKYLKLINEKNTIKHKLCSTSKKIDDAIESLLDKYKKTH